MRDVEQFKNNQDDYRAKKNDEIPESVTKNIINNIK